MSRRRPLAVVAHLRAVGYRIGNKVVAHRLAVEYVEAVLTDVIAETDPTALEELRRDRSIAEYGDFASRTITPEQARERLDLATHVVNANAAALATKR